MDDRPEMAWESRTEAKLTDRAGSAENAARNVAAAGERRGILLIGHGTRNEAGIAEVRQLSQLLAASQPDLAVETCFLELASPGISEGAGLCIERGATHIVFAPLLLFAAGHAKRDIPEAMSEAVRRHPGASFRQTAPLNCHPSVLELSHLRFLASIATAEAVPAEETMLLTVGRGSLDPLANAELARFARLRFERESFAWHAECFTAMARPLLADALPLAAKLGYRRVVVQPHLLFQGELLTRIEKQVAAAKSEFPTIDWQLVPHLGPHPLLIDAILDLANEPCGP